MKSQMKWLGVNQFHYLARRLLESDTTLFEDCQGSYVTFTEYTHEIKSEGYISGLKKACEIAGKVSAVNDSTGRYNACVEIDELLKQEIKKA